MSTKKKPNINSPATKVKGKRQAKPATEADMEGNVLAPKADGVMIKPEQEPSCKQDTETSRDVLEYEIDDATFNYLKEKTDNFKDLIDWGLGVLKSRKTRAGGAAPWNTKASVWGTFMDIGFVKKREMSNVSITQNIYLLEQKIKERRDEVIVSDVKITPLEPVNE